MSISCMFYLNSANNGAVRTVSQNIGLAEKLATTDFCTFYTSKASGLEDYVFCIYDKDYISRSPFLDQLLLMLNSRSQIGLSSVDEQILPMPCGLLKKDSEIIGVAVPKPQVLKDRYKTLSNVLDGLERSRERSRETLVKNAARVTKTLYLVARQLSAFGVEVSFAKIDPSLIFFNDSDVCYLGFNYISIVKPDTASNDVVPASILPFGESSREKQFVDIVDLALGWMMAGNEYRDRAGNFILGEDNDYALRGSTAAFIWSFFSDDLQASSKNCLATESGQDFDLFFKNLDDYASSYSDLVSGDREARLINPTRPYSGQNPDIRKKRPKVASFVWWLVSATIVGLVSYVLTDVVPVLSSAELIMTAVPAFLVAASFWVAVCFTKAFGKVLFVVTLLFSAGWVFLMDDGKLFETIMYSVLNLHEHTAYLIAAASACFALLATILTHNYQDKRNDYYWRKRQ